MTTSLRAPYPCSKATSCCSLSTCLLQLACITGVIFCVLLVSEGQRNVSEERETHATGKACVWRFLLAHSTNSRYFSRWWVSKTAVLGGTLILASTDLASNSLSWIFFLLELSLDLSSNSLSKSTPFHTSVGLSSTPVVTVLSIVVFLLRKFLLD